MKEKQNKSAKEFLETHLYPDLKIAINDLIHEMKTQYSEGLEKEFKLKFYENTADYNKKQKLITKLENSSDSIEDQVNLDLSNNEIDYSEEANPDFEDINEEELNYLKEQLMTTEDEKYFNPIEFICERLKKLVEIRKRESVEF